MAMKDAFCMSIISGYSLLQFIYYFLLKEERDTPVYSINSNAGWSVVPWML